MSNPTIADINQRLAPRMLDLTRALGLGDPSGRSREAVRFRSRGSLSIEVSGPKCGQWYDFEAGLGGDPLGLIAHIHRSNMREAFKWALNWLGEGRPPTYQPSRQAPGSGSRGAAAGRSRCQYRQRMGRAVSEEALG